MRSGTEFRTYRNGPFTDFSSTMSPKLNEVGRIQHIGPHNGLSRRAASNINIPPGLVTMESAILLFRAKLRKIVDSGRGKNVNGVDVPRGVRLCYSRSSFAIMNCRRAFDCGSKTYSRGKGKSRNLFILAMRSSRPDSVTVGRLCRLQNRFR